MAVSIEDVANLIERVRNGDGAAEKDLMDLYRELLDPEPWVGYVSTRGVGTWGSYSRVMEEYNKEQRD